MFFHWASLRRIWLCLYSPPQIRYLYILRLLPSLFFSRLNNLSSPSLSSYEGYSRPLTLHPFSELAPVSPCPLYTREPRIVLSIPDVSHVLNTGILCEPDSNTLPNAAQKTTLVDVKHWPHCWALGYTTSDWTPAGLCAGDHSPASPGVQIVFRQPHCPRM